MRSQAASFVLGLSTFLVGFIANTFRQNKDSQDFHQFTGWAFPTLVKFLHIREVSSANWLILISFLKTLIPWMVLSCLILEASTLVTKIKRYGDKEQPCLTPFHKDICFIPRPLLRIELSVAGLNPILYTGWGHTRGFYHGKNCFTKVNCTTTYLP